MDGFRIEISGTIERVVECADTGGRKQCNSAMSSSKILKYTIKWERT